MVHFAIPRLLDPRVIVDLLRRLDAGVTSVFVSEQTWRDMHYGVTPPDLVEIPPLTFPPQNV